MPYTPQQLTVAVSSRALFDLEHEHSLFEEKGFKAFREYQLAHRNVPLKPGVAFPFVHRLLSLNRLFGADYAPFRVIALSRNSPETAARFFFSCRHYDLPINAGAFTSGQPTFPYIKPFNISLFLSANPKSVAKAIAAGLPAGLVLANSAKNDQDQDPTLRIAFDFDGVLADDEAEREYQKEGLAAFQRLEIEKAATPHSPGPLRDLFQKLSSFQRLDAKLHGAMPNFAPAIRISIVTSRGAQSQERLVTTLKDFGMSAAELFLLDGLEKTPILEAIRPHIFFDDQVRHLEAVENSIPSVLVPFGIHNEPQDNSSREESENLTTAENSSN